MIRLSLLACFSTLLLASSCLLDNVEAARIARSIEPKGCSLKYYDEEAKAAAAKLDRVCEDCGLNLYRDPTLYNRCKDKCYDNEYFFSCVEALLRKDEKDDFIKLIMHLDGGTGV